MLHLDRHEARRGGESMLKWLNRARTAAEVVAGLEDHPFPPHRPVPFPPPPPVDVGMLALALLAARADAGGRFTTVLEVARVGQVTVPALAALLHVGGELSDPEPRPVVGVLLPLRLETRFFPPADGAGWVMKVRVVPDAPSLDRHQQLPTADELDAVETMWRDASADVTTEEGKAQWRRLAARVGAARAAWLARSFPALLAADGSIHIDRPAVVADDLATSRVAGLPRTLELWLGRAGGAPVLVETMTVDLARLDLGFSDPDAGESRWWTSFKEAKAAGLGAEVDLGAARPDDIDVLYVVGLGDDDPALLLADHRDTGILAVLNLGTPTNTVDGEPAADLAGDPETWRHILLDAAPHTGTEQVSLALTGEAGTLGGLPGGDVSAVATGQAMVAALWPALWGHALKDVWGMGRDADALGVWAVENLVPEGPVPPVRIGDQPFGILPATCLAGWAPAKTDPAVEERLVKTLAAVRPFWAASARATGTTFGADTDKLLDLLGRVPTSRGYSWRWFLPLELLHAFWWAFGSGADWARLVEWWEGAATAEHGLGGVPLRRYASLGWPQDLRIPLVVPDNLPPGMDLRGAIERILSFPPNALAGERGDALFERLPNSLLIRLLIHSVVVNAAEVARAAKHQFGPLLDPVMANASVPTELQRWSQQFNEGQLDGGLESRLYTAGRKGADAVAPEDPAVLERVFRATLDTASHRIDPWVTGVAWRRLRSLTDGAPPAQFRLGAYGWVDAPHPRSGAAAPDEYLHAPSEAQALTSAILRDRATSDPEAGRWQVDLDSAGVRWAEQLAAEVRLGAHLSEALGGAVERLVAVRADVERLRRTFPIRTEHAGRRVCDGQAVIARLLSNPASLGLSAGQLAALAPLAEAVDTYGDLLVADAVFDVVSGRPALAAESMEAAAGLASPPELGVLRTQRAGRTVGTTVVIALLDAPGPAAPHDVSTSPGRLAEPAVAEFLLAEVGDPAGGGWTWQVTDAVGAVTGTVTLADLGLEPVDTLSLSPADLARAVLDVGGGEGLLPEDELPAHRRCRRLADILGSQPVVPADLTTDASQPPDAAVHAEVLARYTDVRQLAGDVRTALAAAAAGTAADQRQALAIARRWGITPLDTDEAPLPTLVNRAATALSDRIARSSSVADASTQAVALLARTLAELVSPEGRLPVLSRLRLDQLPTAMTAEPPAAGTAIDPDWLEVVAAVRTPVSRLEAHQLDRHLAGSPAFASWSSRPGDPWQLQAAAPVTPLGLEASTRLVAAFGPAGALEPGAVPGRTVALGLLDSWAEVVPSTEHATSVAFHFDAPGARAPQAILVAVPPDIDVPLDTPTLIDILGETRELAWARMAGPHEVTSFFAGLPLTLFPAAGPSGVRLEPA